MAWGRINLTSGGGTSYNYKITAYSLLANRPASANANDIAIITSTAIPSLDSGGIIFKTGIAAPTVRTDGAALQTGDIWFACGQQSNFPFTGVTGIVLSGQFCFQYNGSAWASKEAHIWYSGAWVIWNFSLYREGNEQSGVTGGWLARAQKIDSATGTLAPTLTRYADRLSATLSDPGNKSGVVEVANNIDLTAATTLKFDMAVSSTGSAVFAIVANRAAVDYYSNASVVAKYTATFTRQIKSLDVSSLSGTFNVCTGARVYGTTATWEIFNVYCE